MKMIKSQIITLLLLVLGSSLAGITPNQLYQELILKYDEIKTFQADIKQTSYYSEIDYTNISEGRIYHNPDKISIEYTSPKAEKITLVGDVVKIYQEEADRLIITYADSTFATLNIRYLIERIWNDDAVILTEDDSLYIVNMVLTDENAIANIVNIEFSIDKKEKLVREVKYQDDSANEVHVVFSNMILNKALKDELWEIEATEATQIIDYRE